MESNKKNNKLNFLMAYPTNIGFGAINRYQELAKTLAKEGTVYYISPKKNAHSPFFKNIIHLSYTALPFKPSFIPLSLVYLSMLRKLKKEDIAIHSVILFNGTHGLILTLFKKLFNYNVIYAIRGSLVDNYHANTKFEENRLKKLIITIQFKIASFIENINLKNSNKVIFQSQAGLDNYKHHFPIINTKKNLIIPNNCNPSWVSKADPLHLKTGFNIAYVGNLFFEKGISLLASAFNRLQSSNSPIYLHYIGKGPHKNRLLLELKTLNILNKTVFHGAIPQAAKHMPSFDLIVLPSYSEAYPNVILEAIYHQTPVFGSNVGGIPHILPPSLLFEPGNDSELANMIQKLKNNKNYQSEVSSIIKNLKKTFSFNWGKQCYSSIITS